MNFHKYRKNKLERLANDNINERGFDFAITDGETTLFYSVSFEHPCYGTINHMLQTVFFLSAIHGKKYTVAWANYFKGLLMFSDIRVMRRRKEKATWS